MEKNDDGLMRSLDRMARNSNKSIREYYYQRQLVLEAFGEEKESYILFGLGLRTDENINSFILNADMRYLYTKYNMSNDIHILDDKKKFANFFKEIYGRKFWINDSNADYESFKDFLSARKYKDLIIKPMSDSWGGRGIKKIETNNKNSDTLYKEIVRTKNVIVEEFIVQHKTMSQFGRGAVNTIRIPTIYDNEKCNVLYATLRVGTNAVVDNFHSGGFVARINKDTGVIESNGFSLKGEEYIHDPYTLQPIKGTSIPYWYEVIKMVNYLSAKLKHVGLVGWDIAITEDGPICIEGNSNPMLPLYECTFKDKTVGHRELLRDFLDEKN